jgi:hypothetical protein
VRSSCVRTQLGPSLIREFWFVAYHSSRSCLFRSPIFQPLRRPATLLVMFGKVGTATESRKDQKTKRFSNLVFDLRCLICGTCAPHQKSPVTKIPYSAGVITIIFIYITYIEIAKIKLFAVTKYTDIYIYLCYNISSIPSASAPTSALSF